MGSVHEAAHSTSHSTRKTGAISICKDPRTTLVHVFVGTRISLCCHIILLVYTGFALGKTFVVETAISKLIVGYILRLGYVSCGNQMDLF